MHHSVKSLFLKVDSCFKFICLIFHSKFSCTCTRKKWSESCQYIVSISKERICKQLMPVSYLWHQMLQTEISWVNTNNDSFLKIKSIESEYLLKAHCIEFEIFDIRVNFTVSTVQKFNTEDKVIVFVVIIQRNFGKAQNHSNNSVLTKLGNYGAEIYLELVVCMYDSQLCVQTSCSILPIKIKTAVVKIYKYFCIFTE